MVLDANGHICDMMVVTDGITKKRGGQRIPLHAELRAALTDLWGLSVVTDGPIVRSLRGGAMKPNSIVH
jgi:hypothetical protein